MRALRTNCWMWLVGMLMAMLAGGVGAEPAEESEPTAATTHAAVAGATAAATVAADDPATFVESITVTSASRNRERLVEAPAAVTVVERQDLELGAPTGQLAKLLEFSPGVELTQNGLYDFNFNVRGFNNALNRRVQVLVDGRNPENGFASTPEWTVFGLLSDHIESVELLRGPSAALYGSNTFNGVINVTTKAPKLNHGGRLRLSAGELDSRRVGASWAGHLGSGWHLQLLGDVNASDDFHRSRNETVEYPGVAFEAIPLPRTDVEIRSAGIRLDRDFAGGGGSSAQTLSVEWGQSEIEGYTLLIPFGRGYADQLKRTWARAHWETPRFRLLGTYNRRDSPAQLSLGPGTESFDDDDSLKLELQSHGTFAQGKGRWVGGVSYGEENVDTANREGIQTLLAAPVAIDQQAVFGQLDFEVGSRLKLVAAARWDQSDLHDAQLSPKAALVYQLPSTDQLPSQTLRLSYNEAFQVPTYIDFFLSSPAGLPITQDQLPIPFPEGVDSIPLFAFGNPDIAVERIRSFELGYSAVIGRRTFVTFDYYFNQIDDFLTDLLPGVNPSFGPYVAPPGVDPGIADGLNAFLPGLTNDAAGRPILVFSFGNTGKVDSQGVEVAVRVEAGRRWRFDANYSWFDFDIRELEPGTAVHPNAPEHRIGAGVVYQAERLRAALRYRWVDGFFWATGIFSGPVPTYDVFELSASYDLSKRWQVGMHVSNLLDDEHYQVFGGSLIGRRALLTAAFRW